MSRSGPREGLRNVLCDGSRRNGRENSGGDGHDRRKVDLLSDGAEPKYIQECGDAVFHFMEIHVVEQMREERPFHMRLVRIEFPRMKIHDERSTLPFNPS